MEYSGMRKQAKKR